MGRLGELLTNFALSEEKHRSEQLEQANAVATPVSSLATAKNFSLPPVTSLQGM